MSFCWFVAGSGDPSLVGGVTRTGFAAYARILHPLHAVLEDRTTTDASGDHPELDAATWRWADVAARRDVAMHPLVTWSDVSGRDDEGVVPFADGWRVSPPEEGWFEPTQLAALTQQLARSTDTPEDLVAGIWDGWSSMSGGSTLAMGWQGVGAPSAAERAEAERWFAGARREHDARQRRIRETFAGPRFRWSDELVPFTASIADLADPTWVDRGPLGDGSGVGHTPQLLWPEDHAWVMATEVDRDSTIVAGTRALVDAVLDDERFEAHEVDEDSELG